MSGTLAFSQSEPSYNALPLVRLTCRFVCIGTFCVEFSSDYPLLLTPSTCLFSLIPIVTFIYLTAHLCVQPGPHGYILPLASVARIVLVLLIMLCYGSSKTFPTLFHHDAWYIVFNVLFGITNGYLQCLPVMYYPM